MVIQSKIVLAVASLALSLPAVAQSKAVHTEMVRLQQQANQLYATDPAAAAALKLKAEALRLSLIPRTPALGSSASNPTGGNGSYSAVAAPYSINGPCGGLDTGTPGNTVSG